MVTVVPRKFMFANCVVNLVTTVVRVKHLHSSQQFSFYEELAYRIKSLLFLL